MRYALAFALLGLGCGSSMKGGGDDAGACATAAQYPCGPYGATQGSVVADLMLSGRRDDNMSGSPLDDAVRDIHFGDYFRDKNVKVLVVLTAAEWCGPCKMEQPSLVSLYGDYASASPGKVAFLESIVQDNAGNVAAQANVDTWTMAYKIPFDMAADPSQALAPYYNVSTFPMQMIIRTSDMTIAWQNNGLAGAQLKSQIDLVLAGM